MLQHLSHFLLSCHKGLHPEAEVLSYPQALTVTEEAHSECSQSAMKKHRALHLHLHFAFYKGTDRTCLDFSGAHKILIPPSQGNILILFRVLLNSGITLVYK